MQLRPGCLLHTEPCGLQAMEQAARRQGIHAVTRLELCDILVTGELPKPLRLLQQGAQAAPDGQAGEGGDGLGSQPFHGCEAPRPQVTGAGCQCNITE